MRCLRMRSGFFISISLLVFSGLSAIAGAVPSREDGETSASQAAAGSNDRVRLHHACIRMLAELRENRDAESFNEAKNELVDAANQSFFEPSSITDLRDANPMRKQRLAYTNRERVKKALDILKAEYANPPRLRELARRVGCSEFLLSRIFSEVTGQTIPQTLRHHRIEAAKILLLEGRLNVTEIAFEVGYQSLSHFSATFREAVGCAPIEYTGGG
jgi:AraC-like DNA-binding protein